MLIFVHLKRKVRIMWGKTEPSIISIIELLQNWQRVASYTPPLNSVQEWTHDVY